MPLTLTLTLVVAFSFLVSRLLQRYAPRRLGSATAYIALGVLVGPELGGLVTTSDLVLLKPFVSLTLGVIGFVLGLPLAKRIQGVGVIETGLLITLITIAALTAATWVAFDAFRPLETPVLPSLTLGAAAAATSLSNLRTAAVRFEANGPVTRFVLSIALVGNVLAVLVSGLALALAGATESASRFGLGSEVWLLASVLLGGVCGLLFHFFIGTEESEERAFLGTVGIIIFTSGMASGMGISSLVLNVLAGMTVALAAGKRYDHSQGLDRLERPAFIVLTILAGAMWRPSGSTSFLAPIFFFVVRAIVLRLASAFVVRVVPRVETVHRTGDGLIPIGGVAIAIAVNYAQVDLPASSMVLTAILGTVTLSELLSLRGLRRLWVDAGEIAELTPRLGGLR